MFNLHYTGNGGSHGLDAFSALTLRNYLFLNLILALDLGESLTEGLAQDMHWPRRGDFAAFAQSFFEGDSLHNSFWGKSDAEKRPEQIPEARAAYSRRCFRIVVAWYAVVRESAERDVAVKSSRASTFGEDELTEQILLALEAISPVFRLPGLRSNPSQILTRDAILPKTASLRSSPGGKIASTSHRHSNPRSKQVARPQSRFVHLPVEIHVHIYSHLTPRCLFSLVRLCRQLHDICTPIIYTDPLAAGLADEPPDRTLHAERVDKLMALLDTRPDLYTRLQRIRVMLPSLHARNRHAVASGLYFYPDTGVYPPLDFALGDAISELTELTLYLPAECQKCKQLVSEGKSSMCQVDVLTALAKIGKRWPELRTLLIRISDSPTHDTTAAAENASELAITSVPRNLRVLTILSWNQFESNQYIPLMRSLTFASALSLRRLSLNPLSGLSDRMSDAAAFPVFPNVVDLFIASDLTGNSVQALLRRSFPSVTSLYARFTGDDRGLEEEHKIDFSVCAPQLKHLNMSFYSLNVVPQSLRTVSVCRRVPLSLLLASTSVEAVFIDDLIETAKIADYLTELGKFFPDLRSLEIQDRWFPMSDRQLVSRDSTITSFFGTRRIAILTVPLYSPG